MRVILAGLLSIQCISKLVGKIGLVSFDTIRVSRARPSDSLLWNVTISRPELHMNLQYLEIG